MRSLTLLLSLALAPLALAQDPPPEKKPPQGEPAEKDSPEKETPEKESSADEKKAREAMQAGNEHFERGRYKEALASYALVLEVDPKAEGALFNAGLVSYLLKSYKDALGYWTRLQVLAPQDWVVRKKLIQAHQALGDTAARDAEIKKLYAQRAAGKDAKLAAKAFFCRDQFRVGPYAVTAYEHFELVGERAIKIYFVVEDTRTRDRKSYHLSLGSYETTNAMFQQRLKKEGKPLVRFYHLDGYEGLNHETWQFYAGEPAYDGVRKDVIGALENRIAREKEEAEEGTEEEDANKEAPDKEKEAPDSEGD